GQGFFRLLRLGRSVGLLYVRRSFVIAGGGGRVGIAAENESHVFFTLTGGISVLEACASGEFSFIGAAVPAGLRDTFVVVNPARQAQTAVIRLNGFGSARAGAGRIVVRLRAAE